MARITVVNDNPEFLELMREILEGDRYDTSTIDGDRADALEVIHESRPDLLVIDLRMGTDGLHGWHVAQEVRRDAALQTLPVLVCSADPFALRELETELADARSTAALLKPFSIEELTEAIDRLLAEAAVQ